MEVGERGGNENVLKPMTGEHFPRGPGVKHLPSDAGNVGQRTNPRSENSILGQRTKISQARGQLSLCASIRKKPAC